MARQKSADHVEALRRQQADIAAKLKEAEAKERARKREDDDRRNRLAGAVILDHLARDPKSPIAAPLRELLAKGLKRPADRALFGDALSSPVAEPARPAVFDKGQSGEAPSWGENTRTMEPSDGLVFIPDTQ
jgi:hypothetical protein